MFRPFTIEWAHAFRDVVDADAAYRAASAHWTWPVALVLDAAPDVGYTDAVAMELALDRGRCHGAVIRHPSSVTAPFVLRAAYADWKHVVRGELDPLAGVVRGRIHVTGSLMTLMMHARSANTLCACARAVPTLFPDEA
jgi:putative sterol carrier protein